jgi:hypothetical protein
VLRRSGAAHLAHAPGRPLPEVDARHGPTGIPRALLLKAEAEAALKGTGIEFGRPPGSLGGAPAGGNGERPEEAGEGREPIDPSAARAAADVRKRRGIERGKGEAPETALAAHARSLDASGLRALILELALARGAYFAWSTKYSERVTAAASAYGVDLAAIEKASGSHRGAQVAQRGRRRRSRIRLLREQRRRRRCPTSAAASTGFR